MESTSSSFSAPGKVQARKNQVLKIRLQTLITSKGIKESQFYKQAGISKQNWYFISWGIVQCPTELKVRIAGLLQVDSAVIWPEVKS